MRAQRRWLSALLRPKVFVPLVLAGALLAFAFSMGNLPSAFSHVRRLTAARLLACLALAWLYLTLKGLQFKWLLHALGAEVAWRPLVLAYAIGEMTIPLPAGVYVQNYVLERVSGELFGFTSAATTAMLALETAVTLVALLFLPIPGAPWVPDAIITLLALTLLAGTGLAAMGEWRRRVLQFLGSGRLRGPGKALGEMLEGLGLLMKPRLLVPVTLLTVLYLTPLVIAVYVVGVGVGLGGFTLTKAASIYLSALAITLLGAGLLTQLGTIEVAGIGVALAWGYGLTQGLALLLGFRLVWIASTWALSGTAAAILWGQRTRSAAHGSEKAPN